MNAFREDPGDGIVPALWAKVLAGLLSAAALSGFGAGVSAWIDLQRLSDRADGCASQLDAINQTLPAMHREMTANTLHRAEHDKAAEYHVRRIDRLEERLQTLSKDPSARADAFTGSEGRALEQRLDRRLKALEGATP